VASSVQAILAQRLVRRVCESCSEAYTPSVQEIEWLANERLHRGDWGKLLHGRGCSHCNGSGYYGRMAVYEMLEMNQTIADAAAHQESLRFMEVARDHLRGKTLLDHAIQLMKAGVTTIVEVMRISNQVED
jgi:MSHA biogenesis protein MshE